MAASQYRINLLARVPEIPREPLAGRRAALPQKAVLFRLDIDSCMYKMRGSGALTEPSGLARG